MSKNTATVIESGHPESLSQELKDQIGARGLRQEPNQRLRFPVSRSALSKVFAAFFAIISILLVAEGLARSIICGINPIEFGSREFDSKMRLANTPLPPGKPCIYFLGSSHTSRAIYADLIAARLQQAGNDILVRNIACTASYPKENLLILEHALRASPGPAMVIYECNQICFAVPESVIDEYSPTFKKSLYVKNLQSDWPVFKGLDLWMKQNVYLVRYRTILKERLLQVPANVFSPGESVWNKTPTVANLSDISPSGWAPLYPMLNEETLKSSIDRIVGQIEAAKSEVAKKRARYFFTQNIFALARKQNLKTAMLWLPLHPRFQTMSNKSMSTNAEEMQARMLNAAKIENCPLIDVHNYAIEQNFTDADHLNTCGAVEISNEIADMLLAQSDIFIKPLLEGAK